MFENSIPEEEKGLVEKNESELYNCSYSYKDCLVELTLASVPMTLAFSSCMATEFICLGFVAAGKAQLS
jgi:hypothetical protein